MIRRTLDAPDFFQQEDETALHERAQWLEANLGLGSPFLAKVLREDESTIRQWREKQVRLSADSEGNLRALWHALLHLLSHYNNEEQHVRNLLEQTIPGNRMAEAASLPVERAPALFPPWFDSSLKSYLETRGVDAIAAVNHWIMSLRFGDLYSTSSQATTWP